MASVTAKYNSEYLNVLQTRFSLFFMISARSFKGCLLQDTIFTLIKLVTLDSRLISLWRIYFITYLINIIMSYTSGFTKRKEIQYIEEIDLPHYHYPFYLFQLSLYLYLTDKSHIIFWYKKPPFSFNIVY